MLVFNWLCLPGWCVGNGKVSHNFGEHPCTVLVSHADSITILFSRGWYFDEPGTLTFIVYLYDENENGHGRMWQVYQMCVFVVFVSQVYRTPAPIMPLLQQPRKGLRSVAFLKKKMKMQCGELRSPKSSFAATGGRFGCSLRISAVFLHTQRVSMHSKGIMLHYVWIFWFMISDSESDTESEIPKYCTLPFFCFVFPLR